MADLVDFLETRGFETVETELPGGWATDGEHTVQINTEHGPRGIGPHTVRVFEGAASELGVDSTAVAIATNSAHNRALREAFAGAGLLEEAEGDR